MLFWDLTKLSLTKHKDNNFFGKILLSSLALHLFFIFFLFLVSKLRNATPLMVIGNVGRVRSAKVRFASTGKFSASSNHKVNNMNLTDKKTINDESGSELVTKTNEKNDSKLDKIINMHEKLNETKKLISTKSKVITNKIENKQNKANAKTTQYSKLPIDLNNKLELEDFKSNDKKIETEKKSIENGIAYSKIKLNQDTQASNLEKESDKVEANYTKLDKDKTVLLESEVIKEEIKKVTKIEKQEIKLIEKAKADANLVSDKKIDDKTIENKSLGSEAIETNGLTNNLENKDLIINDNIIYQNDSSIPDWEQKLVLDISQNLKIPHGFEKHEPLIVTLNIDKIGKANIEEFEGCAIPALKAAVANFFQSFIFPAKMHGASRKLIIK